MYVMNLKVDPIAGKTTVTDMQFLLIKID